ncbi:MAG: hypothetical protein AOA65_1053 [Candidatus Bathyarchaeota archaeon BA1]|nr:MAG: hypothetical protein AOA65_1053 [Candidatus Bathyarchaeota archaeon BA1]
MQKSVEKIEAVLNELRERTARIEGRLEELSKRIDTVNHRIDDLRAHVDKRIDGLKWFFYVTWGSHGAFSLPY